MKMACAGTPGNLARVVETKAAAYRNDDTVRGAFHESSEHCRTGGHIGSASRGENAMAASGDYVLKSLFQIGCGINGAVEGDFEGMGELDERASTFNIHGAVGEKCAENDAGGPNTAHVLNLAAHVRECGGIAMEALRV